MNSNGILHCTVNDKGAMRIWNSPADAKAGKSVTEVMLQLSLTKPQMALVLRAEQLSREKANGARASLNETT
jgi:hypothetical protein